MQGMSEAETSHEVHRFTCQARSKLEAHLDLRLEGLGRLTGEEVFSHELIIPPGKQSALGNTLQLTLVPGCLKQPGDPLRWARVCVGHPLRWGLGRVCVGILSGGEGKGLRGACSQVGVGKGLCGASSQVGKGRVCVGHPLKWGLGRFCVGILSGGEGKGLRGASSQVGRGRVCVGHPLKWGLGRVCVGILSGGEGLRGNLALLAGQLTMNRHGTVEAGCGSQGPLSASDPIWLLFTKLCAARLTGPCLQKHSLLSRAAQLGTHLQPCSH